MSQTLSDKNSQRDILGLLDKVAKTGVPVDVDYRTVLPTLYSPILSINPVA